MSAKKSVREMLSQIEWYRLIIWCVVILICIPFLRATCYAVFRADDFSNVLILDSGESYMATVWNRTISCWRTWQGTYASCLFLYFLNPLNHFSYSVLRTILFILALLVIVSFFFFISTAIDYFGIERHRYIYIVAILLLPMLSYREYTEVYLWFTGAIVYLLPVVFLLFGFSFLFLGKKTGKMYWYVLSALMFFLMAGGVLEVVGFGMFLLLLFVVLEYLRAGKINKPFLCVFIVALSGALLNAVAPGNYVRHDAETMGEKINLLRTIMYSFKLAFDEAEWLLRDTSFLFFVFAAMWIGIGLKIKPEPKKIVVCVVGLLLLPVVTLFPVVMGYNSVSFEGFPNRAYFPLDMSIIIALIGISLLVGSQLAVRDLLPDIKTVRMICGLAMLMAVCTQGNKILENVPPVIAGNLYTGAVQNHTKAWTDIYEAIGSSPESQVVVTLPNPGPVIGGLENYISSEPDYWINQAIASYYGKESVSYIPGEAPQ